MTGLLDITMDVGTQKLISTVTMSDLDSLGMEITRTVFSCGINNKVIDQCIYNINVFPIIKDYILICIVNITDYNFFINSHIKDTITFCSSADFTYGRFIESIRRMIGNIVSYNLYISNIDNTCSLSRGHWSAFYTYPNHSGQGFWAYFAYMSFMRYKANLACFMALMFMFVRCLSSNKFLLYLFLLILQARPVGALNNMLVNKLIAGIGWFIYINGMAWYDITFKNKQSALVSQTLFVNGRINFILLRQRLLLGLFFAFVINIGVLFSSSFSYIIVPNLTLRNSIIAVVSSYIISTIASTAWIFSTRRELLGYGWRAVTLSYIRAFCESVAFNALSLANFIIWSWFPQRLITYIITFVVGLLCYFAVSYYQIILETNLNNRFIYGLLYNFVFSSLSISSSGLYSLMDIFIHSNLPLRITLLSLCHMIMTFFPLEVYRFRPPTIILGRIGDNNTLLAYILGRERANNPRVRHLVGMLYQLVVFFAFAIGTFIWLDFTGLAG